MLIDISRIPPEGLSLDEALEPVALYFIAGNAPAEDDRTVVVVRRRESAGPKA